jgi:CubicO group peptidase (beta-lactamase class C family)
LIFGRLLGHEQKLFSFASFKSKMRLIYLFGFMFLKFFAFAQKPILQNLLKTPASLPHFQVDSFAEKMRHYPSGTQLAIALIDGENVSYWGIRRVDDTLQNMENQNLIFEIGSISKVFTSTLLAHFVHNGSLSLNQPVRELLSFPVKDTFNVTLQQLSNHSSGLPRLPMSLMWAALKNPDNPYKDFDKNQIEEYLTKSVTLSRKPGTRYDYSNIGAGLLGFALAEKAGSAYEQLMMERVFMPLGMNQSTLNIDETGENLVYGQDPKGKIASHWDLAAIKGAGGILSSVSDLSKFITANFDPNQKILALQREKTFQVNEKMSMALGWHIIHEPSGDLYFHNGGTGGYTSSMLMDMTHKKGIVILSNISAFHPRMAYLDKLCFELLRQL